MGLTFVGSLKKDSKGECFKRNDEVGTKANVVVLWLGVLLYICEVLASSLIVLPQATTSVGTCKVRVLQLKVI